MELTPKLHRKLQIAGALFGLALGVTLGWYGYVYPFFVLRDIPINAASFSLNTGAVVLATAISIIGAALGGYLVARFWDRTGLALLLGAATTMLVLTLSAIIVTTANMANSVWSEFILYYLPVGVIFGALLSFLGGLVGSGIERVVLSGAARMFERGGWATLPAWVLVLLTGAVLGFSASGGGPRRDSIMAAAQAVDSAIHIAQGQAISDETLPPGFAVSDPALDTLRGFGPRLQQPYVIRLGDYDGIEVVTDIQFQDGLAVRCVSTVAHISRCFEIQIQ
jgi:hypothetical protein